MNRYLRFELSLNHMQVIDERSHLVVVSVLLEPNGVTWEKGWKMIGEAVKNYVAKHGST